MKVNNFILWISDIIAPLMTTLVSSVTTSPSSKSYNTARYIVFSLLLPMICLLFLIFLMCLRRQQDRYIIDDEEVTNSDRTDSSTDTSRSQTSPSQTPSLSSTQYTDANGAKKAELSFGGLFDDKAF